MKKEQLVPTLETCGNLAQYGFTSWDTPFRWIETLSGWELVTADVAITRSQFNSIAAPTLDEILQVLFKQLTGYPELRVFAKTLILFPDEGQQSHTLIGSNRAEVAALLYIDLHALSNERPPVSPHPTTSKQNVP